MKIVIAPDSFKESLDAPHVARAIAEGLRRVLPAAALELVPVADGGEGTTGALVAATGGRLLTVTVSDPLGRPREATYGILGDGETVVLEMAQASGLALLAPAERNAAITSSFGTGELIRAALAGRPARIIVGLGGSATNDGGAGMLQALGVRLLDRDGWELRQPMSGGSLAQVAAVDAGGLDPRLREVRFMVACDVDNSLLGLAGASAVFGPQKGAKAHEVAALDHALAHFYQIVEATMQCSVSDRPGAGAAGGLGAALLAFLPATLRPGSDLVLEAVDLDRRLQDAQLVVTGEGRLDAQTARGKAPAGVARLAAARGIPVVAICGSLADESVLWQTGLFAAVEVAITRPVATSEALRDAYPNIVHAAARAGEWLKLGRRLFAVAAARD